MALYLGACGTVSNKNISPRAEEVLSSDNLPIGLADVKIFWTVPEKEAVYITSIDQTDIDIVHVVGNDITLSADYKYLAYVSSQPATLSSIRLVNIQTKDDWTLVSVAQDIPNALRLQTPAFSPDNENIIFQVDITDTKFDIGSVDFSGENLHFYNTEGLNTEPKFSPNKEAIITICEGKDAVGFNICIIDASTGKRTRLTDREGFHQAYFSPIGEKIIFSYYKLPIFGRSKSGLYTMNVDGSNQTMLLNWRIAIMGLSPDGKSIIFRRMTDENPYYGDIYIMDVSTQRLLHLEYFDYGFIE